MHFLANLLIGKPLSILLIAFVFMIIYLIFRKFNLGHRARYLGLTSILWLLYALWELLIKLKTPDADIRVDLLIIWPVIFILSLLSIILLFFNKQK